MVLSVAGRFGLFQKDGPRSGKQPALKHMNYSMYEKWFAGVLEAWEWRNQ